MGSFGTDLLPPRQHLARFGVFEFDLVQKKLFRDGRDVGLQQQPATLLAHLLRTPGSIITRDELRNTIWPSGTHVEFEYGLNTAVNRVRRALRDSASDPRYIETIPKQGYRFIAPVEVVLPATDQAIASSASEEQAAPTARKGEPEASRTTPFALRPFRIGGSSAWKLMAGLLLFALVTAIVTHFARPKQSEPAAVVRSYLLLPEGHTPEVVVISPQGDQIVYQTVRAGVRQLYRRLLDEEESRVVPQSEGASQPFFSPDGKELAFYTKTSIRVTGSKGTRDLVSVPPEFDLRRAIWGDDGYIYYTTPDSGIWRVPAAGGAAHPFLKAAHGVRGAPFYFPQQLLPTPTQTLLVSSNNGPKHRWIATAVMNATWPPEVLVDRAMGGQVLPGGELIYFWQGKLLAAPYDGGTGKLKGSPVEAVNDVAQNGWRGPGASVSNNGTLVYLERHQPRMKLVWIDRHGRETPLPIPQAAYEQAEVSPDGRKIAISRQDRPGLWSLWIYEIRSSLWNHLLDQEMPAPRCTWSPDGDSLVASLSTGDAQFVNLFRINPADPSKPERLAEDPVHGQFPGAWSASAKALLFTTGVHDRTQSDIFALPLNGDRIPRPLVASTGVDRAPAFSPDGRWFAYSTDTSGRSEVFVQRFDQSLPRQQISTAGGSDPVWSHDGTRLFFLNFDRALMEVQWEPNGKISEAHELFRHGFAGPRDWWTRAYSLAPDGRFLVIGSAPGGDDAPRIHVVVNWKQELQRLLPGLPSP